MLGTHVDGRRQLDLCQNLIFVDFDDASFLINCYIAGFFSSYIKPVNWTVIFLLCFRSSINNHVLLKLIPISVGLRTMIVPQMRLIDLKYTIKDFNQEGFRHDIL